MHRVVFDTVVFVRSLINPHSGWGRVLFEHADRYRLFLSRPLITEILEVLQRPELARKFRGIEAMDMTVVLEMLGRAEVVEVAEIPHICRDANDDKFLATAIAMAADYLVSADDDLLDIKEYEGTKIIDAVTFLDVLGKEENT